MVESPSLAPRCGGIRSVGQDTSTPLVLEGYIMIDIAWIPAAPAVIVALFGLISLVSAFRNL